MDRPAGLLRSRGDSAGPVDDRLLGLWGNKMGFESEKIMGIIFPTIFRILPSQHHSLVHETDESDEIMVEALL